MANKGKGFVKLYRSIQDHWLWTANTKFDERSAWVDLILSVNHKENKLMIDGRLRVIKPGQMWTSYGKLAERWGWSVGKVKRYTKILKSDGMIYTDGSPSGTLLTLVNYRDFAGEKTTDGPIDGPTDEPTLGPTDEPTDGLQTRNIKNDKNDKERKNWPRFARDPVEDY